MKDETKQRIKECVQSIRQRLSGNHSFDWYGSAGELVMESEITKLLEQEFYEEALDQGN